MNFIIPYYEDERMIYTQKYLVNQGYHEVFDKSKADFAVFSPACDKENFAPYENKTVFYGAGDYDKKHKNFFDYNKREDFKYKNALLTREGAIAIYKENSDKALLGANILITGFGTIGKALCSTLKNMGAKVTVCARSSINQAQAETIADKIIDFSSINCSKYDVIFNTVSAVYFTKKEIDTFKNDTIYIELASFPGGIDKHYAKSKNINIIVASKLPSRYSKETAGYLIGEAIDKMIKEGKVWKSVIA